VRLIPPSDNTNPVAHFLASVNDPIEHALRDVDSSVMVGMTIQNQVNENDKPIGMTFRRKDKLSAEVIWSVFEKVSQSNCLIQRPGHVSHYRAFGQDARRFC